MNTFTTTALLSAAAAALVLGLQRRGLATLEEKADELRSEIVRLERPIGLSSVQSPSSEPGGKSADSPVRRGAQAVPRAEVNLETIHGEIEALMAANGVANPAPRKMVEVFDKLLELVADCTAPDLEQLVKRLGGLEQKGKPDGMIPMILQMLAMDQDPRRYLEAGTEGGVMATPEMQGAALSASARQDPEAAMRWITANRDKLGVTMQRGAYVAIGGQLLRQDAGLAAEFFAQLEPESRRGTLSMLAASGLRQSRELIAVAQDLPDEGARRDLVKAATASIMVHEGVEAGREALALLADSAEYSFVVRHTAADSVDARPVETMNWLMNSEPGSAEAEAVGNTISNWAHADYGAAAAWLTEQPASPNRDQAIQGFAQVVRGLDPEAATIWAAEIADPNLREPLLRSHLASWRERDPEAARKWEDARKVEER